MQTHGSDQDRREEGGSGITDIPASRSPPPAGSEWGGEEEQQEQQVQQEEVVCLC